MNAKETRIYKVYLSLGSNLGERSQNLRKAEEQLALRLGKVLLKSSDYKSKAVGFDSAHDFINNALCVACSHSPSTILSITQSIEIELGRVQKSLNGLHFDRIIDIDILYIDDLVLSDEKLQVPHPELHLRAFVLNPLCEIAPKFIHPTLRKTNINLLAKL